MVLLLSSSCSTLFSSQTELMDNVYSPRVLETIDIKINRMSYWDANMACLELAGLPKIGFLLLYTMPNCALVPDDNWLLERGEAPWCKVILSQEFALKHELNHCKGYKD